jgi:HEAT repeat protein
LESLFKALGRLGGPRAQEALLPFVTDDREGFRMAALRALVGVGHRPFAPELVRAMDKCRPMRYADVIIEEMGRIDHPAAVRWLQEETRKRVGQWPVSGPVTAFGGFGKTNTLAAIARIEALARFGGSRVVDELLAYLQHAQMRVRASAMEALGRIGDRRAVPNLLKELNDPCSVELRHFAVRALEQIGDARAAEAVTALLDCDSYGLRALAARALRSVAEGGQCAPALMKALEDPHWLVRTEAAESLGALKAKPALEALTEALGDSVSDVRAAAAAALGRLGAKQAAGRIVACLADWDAGPLAAEALDKLGWTPAGKPADRVRYLVAHRRFAALRKQWNAVRDVLLADLKADGPAGLNAAFALIALGKEEAIPQLSSFLDAADNPAVAAALLNCGHGELQKLAARWAKRNQHGIALVRCAAPVLWGGWR